MSFTQPTKVPPAYEDVYVQEGRDAKLVWTYSVGSRDELNLQRAVVWYITDPSDVSNVKELIVEKRDRARQNSLTIPSYLTGRIGIEDPATLVISNVKTTDENFYQCELKTSSLEYRRRTIRLTVISK